MKRINNYIKYLIVQIKIHIKLHLVYPYNPQYKSIKSIMPNKIKLGKGVKTDTGVNFSNHLEKIGDHVYIGQNTYIGYCKSIGNFSSISFDVKLGIDSHPFHFVSTSAYFYSTKRGFVENALYKEENRGLTEVGCDVMIGTQAMILSGVKLGHGCIVAAGSLVNKNVPPYAIVRGSPAKVVAYRFDEETIAKLLKSEWWNFTETQYQKYKSIMCEIEKFVEEIEKDHVI